MDAHRPGHAPALGLRAVRGRAGQVHMFAESARRVTSDDLLRQVLLNYLLGSTVGGWPGADGLTRDDVLRCYPEACARGEVPDRRELCRRHAELSAGIAALFTSNGWPEVMPPGDRH